MAQDFRADAVGKEPKPDRGREASRAEATGIDGPMLPWAYGRDRVTVIVRDPDSAYVYWEITDEAIRAALRTLGASNASCNLRVYDTTGRLFDGSNANEFFDVGIQRTDRKYFLFIQRPGRIVHIEIGLKADDGRFQPIARSGAAWFPRKEPSSNVAVEWTTVATDHSHPSTRPYTSCYRAAAPAAVDAWQATASEPDREGRIVSERSELIRIFPEAARLHRSDPAAFARWAGLLLEGRAELLERFEWQAGPFPVELRGGAVEIRFAGGGPPVVLERQGIRFLTQGPWNLVIRGVSPTSGGRILGTWSVRWSIASGPLLERWSRFLERRRTGAFAHKALSAAGGSERVGAFEQGASEQWRLGASERLLIGASERWLRGASELFFAGASERALAGASEQRWLGASGRWAGGSEQLWAGASERWFPGASEQQRGSASDAFGREPWRRDT